ncbi:hypothetical protein F5Y15DRAFT_380305 [Xylariaceae sp. FL0016]|nr:hypothetical protein F5Y15DRAFT_380305 [Xylariaceae sp. FL0016]
MAGIQRHRIVFFLVIGVPASGLFLKSLLWFMLDWNKVWGNGHVDLARGASWKGADSGQAHKSWNRWTFILQHRYVC